jgi:hypothetical protein
MNHVKVTLNWSVSVDDSSNLDIGDPISTDRSSALFSQLYSVTWALHLLYEEIKLGKVVVVKADMEVLLPFE